MRILLLLLLPFFSCAQVVIPGVVASSKKVSIPAAVSGQFIQEIATSNTERLQRVVLYKHEAMQDDYRNIRFITNPAGPVKDKLYLPYYIEESNADSAVIWVGFRSTAPDRFSALWGENLSAYSSGYRTFDAAGYYFNDFSRGMYFDVVNVLGGYDLPIAVDPDGEETWPAGWQNPGNPLNCGVIYKRQDTNIHAGNPNARTGMKITTDGFLTVGDEMAIDDPEAEFDCSSVSSVAIPTTHPTEVTFTKVGGEENFQPGDIGQARADDTHYFGFEVVSDNGTTLIVNSTAHVGTGTFSDWTISKNIGATNATITAVRLPNSTLRLIMLNSHVDYTVGDGTIRVGTKYSDDFGETWSEWQQRGPDEWINVGGQAITLNNGYCIFSAHQNFGIEEMTEHKDWFFLTRDYGVTWDSLFVQDDDVYLDEAGMFQMKDTTTWEWIEDKVKVITRNENSPFHYQTFYLTVTDEEFSNTEVKENNFYLDEQSRATYTWADNRIWGAFGDVREQMVYSDDSGETWHPVPYTTIEGNIYSSRRVYTIMYYFGDGKLAKVWTNNKLSGGADTYVNFWDTYLMSLRAVSTSTLTDTRTRPIDLDPGLKINGSLVEGYRTTSTTSVAIPTSHPTEVTFTVDAGLSWQAGDVGTATRTITGGGNRFVFTVVSYSGTTLVVNSSANTGTGTFATWTIDKNTNFQSDQAFISTWNANGQTKPFKLIMRNKSPSPHGGFYGLKKDETRATATVTVSDAGNEGDTIIIKWSATSPYGGLFSGLGKVAQYIVQSGDEIKDVVDGLYSSAAYLNICPPSDSTHVAITLQAPRGEGTNINTQSFTIETVGDVAASSGTFSGGAAQESVTALQNVINFSGNTTRIEQANDNHTQTLTNPLDQYNDYTVEWTPTLITARINAGSVTKGPATGSGVPDWDGQIIAHVTTSATAPWAAFESVLLMTRPIDDPVTTLGDISEGEWTYRPDGQGIDQYTLDIIINAGPDQTIQDDETVQLSGDGPAGSLWTTSGDGSFDDNELLNAVYTPGATDISSGSVVLTLSLGEVSDALTVTIEETVEGFTYTAIPTVPTFTDTQSLSSGSTGNSVTFAELGGKTDLLINGDYPFIQANGWGDNTTYRIRSTTATDPSTWAWLGQFGADLPAAGISNTGTTMPNIELYNIKIHHADAGIKWGPYSSSRSQKYQNVIVDSTGFAGLQINSAGTGLFYGDLTISYLMGSYTEGELTYLGRTGGAEVSLYEGVTTVSHVYGYHIGREVIQLNGHAEAHVSHVTGIGDGVNLGEGIGQNNPFQFQNILTGSCTNSIFLNALSPGVIATHDFLFRNVYVEWITADRPFYVQNMVANSYDTYVNPGGTITWEGINIFDNPGYTGNVVFLLQDPVANYHFKDTIYVPASATSHYADQRISPTGTITDEAVWIETNDPPRPTLGLPPEEEYQAYQKVVTDPYFYSRGFGFRTPDPE